MRHNILFTILAVLMLTSCNNTDIDLFDSPETIAGQGTLATTQAGVNALEFDWQPIDGVNQYGYKLTTEANNTNRMGVTRSTHIRFENLEPDTEYTLRVEAYGQNGKPTQVFNISAATDPIRQLATPDASKMTMAIESGQVIIEWEAVPNAKTYDYALYTTDGKELDKGTVEETTITFGSLPNDTYVLELTADTDDVAYTRSETARYNFEKARVLLNSYTGTYTSPILGANTCALKIYDDGAYVIESFYGVEGYNLEFSLVNGVITILNHYEASGKYKFVDTGLAEPNDVITVYEDPSYCTYTVKPTSKQIKLYVYLGDAQTGDYDTFVWKDK